MERIENQMEQEQKSKTEKILVNLQQEVEGSFNRIHAQLDQLLNDKCNLINILPSQVSSDLPKLNSIPLLQFQNDDFPQLIIQNVIPLIKIYSQVQLKNNAQQLIQQKANQQNEHCQEIAKPIEKFTQPPQAQNSPNFIFSTVLKSPTITIIEKKNAHQTANQIYDNRFILIEPRIMTSCKIAIKITYLANWIGIGIAYKNVLSSNNMKFDWNYLGHGSYMNSSNTCTWSHSKKEENMVQKSFTFTTGDIIIVDVSLENKTLKFTCKNKRNDTQVLTFDPPYNDDIHFCINMCSSGEKVEILDDWE
ncbi:unnamed protein product [Paramecium octaurelia]|uniref:B30.2/SPRY domain-containing protein n=1 Tax=Paramecium octaurelia TaxID=43137 RepID=A0A8S1RU75_PAROT|nr:unnamed protein product [Paramecium octaurelia]